MMNGKVLRAVLKVFISVKNKAKFEVALLEVAEQFTADHDWSHVLWTDGQLQSDEFTMELAEQLRQSTPWGQGFPEPVFDGEFEVLEARIVGDTHAKLRLKPVDGTVSLDAICFGYLDSHERLPEGQVRIAYRLDVNEFRDRLNLQLMVQSLEN